MMLLYIDCLVYWKSMSDQSIQPVCLIGNCLFDLVLLLTGLFIYSSYFVHYVVFNILYNPCGRYSWSLY